MKVLIVEDEALLAMSYKMDLEAGDYNIVGIASNADAAFRLTELHKPDVILMDIKLQGKVDGIAAAQKIMASYNIPIIYITGNIDELTKQRAMDTNPKGYMEKPVDSEKLSKLI